jgi:predicted metalloendopeptidase
MIKKNKTRKIGQNDKDLICGTNVILYKSFQKQYTYKELLNFNNSTNNYYAKFNSFLKEPAVKPSDDFYNYVNEYWYKNKKISLNTYNTFDKIQEKVYDEIFEIYKELIETSSTSKEIVNMKEFYDSANTLMTPQNSIDNINNYIDNIVKLTNDPLKNNLWRILAITCKNKIVSSSGSPIFFDIKPDEKNTSTYSIYFEPIKHIFPIDFFFNDNNTELNESIVSYVGYLNDLIKTIFGNNNTLGLNGTDYIEVLREIALCFYEKVGDSNDNTLSYYKLNTKSTSTYTFNYTEFLKEIGFNTIPNTCITINLNYFKNITSLMLKKWNTIKWRNYWILIYIEQVARFTNKWHNSGEVLFSKFIRGNISEYADRVRPVKLLLIPFNNLLSRTYVAKYKNDYSINYIKFLINDLKIVLYKNIKQNKWMDSKTIRYALLKIKNIKVFVGESKYVIDDPDINFINNDIWGNLIRIMDWKLNELILLINKPVTLIPTIDWTQRPFVFIESQAFIVNARYNRSTNSIFVPLAFLQKPFIDLEESGIAYNISNMGYILAHELLHSLDITGSKYDLNGNLKDWWTNNDKKHFFKIQENIKEQYMLAAKKDNQEINITDISISENFADVNSIYLCVEYLKDYQFKFNVPLKLAKLILEDFYVFYANNMKEKLTSKFVHYRILYNPHALNKYRVNIPLSRLDTFQAMYNVKKGDNMYWNNKLSFF